MGAALIPPGDGVSLEANQSAAGRSLVEDVGPDNRHASLTAIRPQQPSSPQVLDQPLIPELEAVVDHNMGHLPCIDADPSDRLPSTVISEPGPNSSL
jgi:hypothetical protein